MCTLHPEVKVFIGSGRVILEGPDAEVQSGAYKLDELIKKVKEKRVKLSTALMNFITSSGAMSKYQARFRQIFRSPVSLEVGSDLVFASLSSDALNEAEMLLQRDLILANVPLQEAASSDLDRVKELLNKAKNEANSRELRVDVSFIPGLSGATATDVQLVGYSKNVNKLKEVLNDYQMNQAITQETLQLRPELLDCFDKITDMIGMKKTKVTLRASSFPYPCVLVSGPNCQVQEAVQALSAALASLKSETLVLDGPGALQYFQAEGKLSKELVESSCQVIIREKQRVHSPDLESKPQSTSSLFTSSSACWPTPPSRVWQKTLGGTPITKINLEIRLGSLEDEQVNVLVAPMLNKQLNSSKIGKCLLHKAGSAIKLKFDSAAANCTVVPGDVLQVDAPPFLGCSKLFFIECMPWDGVLGQSVKALGNGLKKCVDLCVQQRLSSVAFPIIGPGIILNYPLTEAIQVLTESIIQFGLSASSGSLATIHVVIKPGYPDSEEVTINT
ncbi:uncharacterized protein LOC121938540 [Plectropomus leopardus]|uniref:uncharacterized protein LOC121938540 n=1 Tax=Plectropomus leopardus TaxID=160734 RepID=UPI001C4C71C6|nr:uncharacterized protein LOC121938540 [Plectropomus leopardus]